MTHQQPFLRPGPVDPVAISSGVCMPSNRKHKHRQRPLRRQTQRRSSPKLPLLYPSEPPPTTATGITATNEGSARSRHAPTSLSLFYVTPRRQRKLNLWTFAFDYWLLFSTNHTYSFTENSQKINFNTRVLLVSETEYSRLCSLFSVSRGNRISRTCRVVLPLAKQNSPSLPTAGARSTNQTHCPFWCPGLLCQPCSTNTGNSLGAPANQCTKETVQQFRAPRRLAISRNGQRGPRADDSIVIIPAHVMRGGNPVNDKFSNTTSPPCE